MPSRVLYNVSVTGPYVGDIGKAALHKRNKDRRKGKEKKRKEKKRKEK
jgi:hypothetical protein